MLTQYSTEKILTDGKKPKGLAKIWWKLKRPFGHLLVLFQCHKGNSCKESCRKESTWIDSSQKYWNERYESGGNSGAGSYGKFASWKAEILNGFVKKKNIQSVIELGCGDGNQLSLAEYSSYLGFDVSERAVEMCRERFENDHTKSFKIMNEHHGEKAELSLSLDVIYHLVEDGVFENYMRRLFESSNRFVIVYSSNDESMNANTAPHVRHRKFTEWIDKNCPGWQLLKSIPNKYPYQGDHLEGSFANFFFYEITQDELHNSKKVSCDK